MTTAQMREPYHYLFGPMTGYPKQNFPRFMAVADRLRGDGRNIVSPAELDDPATFKKVMNGGMDDDPYGDDYLRFIRRDIQIVTHPNCLGGIGLEGWTSSRGARIETFLMEEFELELLQYVEFPDGRYELLPFKRDDALYGAAFKSIEEYNRFAEDNRAWHERVREAIGKIGGR